MLAKIPSGTFYFSVEQHLGIIFQPKCLNSNVSKCLKILFILNPFSCPLLSIKIIVSPVINLLLTSLARDRSGRISALGLFCTDQAQGLRPIFSQYGPRAWFIRCMYLDCLVHIQNNLLIKGAARKMDKMYCSLEPLYATSADQK